MSSMGSSTQPFPPRTSWNYGIVVWFIGIHLIAAYALTRPSITGLLSFFVLYFVTACLGITLCYHRLLTHRSFRLWKPLERVFATCGVFALQGSPLMWVGHHRMHHAHSDSERDPHDSTRGFWYSHLYWLLRPHRYFDDPANIRRFARDIVVDPYYRFLDPMWVMVSLQILLACGLYGLGGWDAVLWGIFVRLVVVYHVTWFVNSASHMWGYRNYESSDESRNCWWVGILAWGEGWHNNHHAHPDVARAGHYWWEIDITYILIALLNGLGLADQVRGINASLLNKNPVLSDAPGLDQLHATSVEMI